MGSGDSGCFSLAEVKSLIFLILILFTITKILLIIKLINKLIILIIITILLHRSVQETLWEGRRVESWKSGSRTFLTGSPPFT